MQTGEKKKEKTYFFSKVSCKNKVTEKRKCDKPEKAKK